MAGNTVTLPDNTLIEVKLSADSKEIVSLGIRINGSNWCVLASGVTLPRPGYSQTWCEAIGDIMEAPSPTNS
jgi:hypothetical protein